MNKTVISLVMAGCLLLTSCSSKSSTKCNKFTKWQDCYENSTELFSDEFEKKTELKEFPDTEFIWTGNNITASKNGENKVLVEGMPVWNAYFADLNGDDFPELCASISFGSGIVDNHVVVYDYHNDKQYSLLDRTEYNYMLCVENDKLVVKKTPYGRYDEQSDVKTGWLSLEDDKLDFIE